MGWTTSMIALPCGIVGDEGHCTIEYLGDTSELSTSPEELVETLREFETPDELRVGVIGIRLFGVKTGSPVWVAQLDDYELKPLFEKVSAKLEKELGVENASSYKDERYKPHVTIKDFESYSDLDSLKDFPQEVSLGPMEVWWNEERFVIR